MVVLVFDFKIVFLLWVLWCHRILYARLLMSYHYDAGLVWCGFSPFALSFLLLSFQSRCGDIRNCWSYNILGYWLHFWRPFNNRLLLIFLLKSFPFFLRAFIRVIVKKLIIFEKSCFNLSHGKFSLPFYLTHIFLRTLTFAFTSLLWFFILFYYLIFIVAFFHFFLLIWFLWRVRSRSSSFFIFIFLLFSASLSWSTLVLLWFLFIFVLFLVNTYLYIPNVPVR